jgi:hypothetical protein
MGLKSINVGKREALEIACDRVHKGDPPTAWFDCGSDLGNLTLALTIGWTEWRSAKRKWFCAQCAHKAALKRNALAETDAA